MSRPAFARDVYLETLHFPRTPSPLRGPAINHDLVQAVEGIHQIYEIARRLEGQREAPNEVVGAAIRLLTVMDESFRATGLSQYMGPPSVTDVVAKAPIKAGEPLDCLHSVDAPLLGIACTVKENDDPSKSALSQFLRIVDRQVNHPVVGPELPALQKATQETSQGLTETAKSWRNAGLEAVAPKTIALVRELASEVSRMATAVFRSTVTAPRPD